MKRQKRLEALRGRYENGDGLALFEAVYLLPPKQTDAPFFDHCPEWLHWAMVDYVRSMALVESSAKALGLETGKGIPSATHQFDKRRVEDRALAIVEGIKEGRRKSGIPYIEGENAYSIAARVFQFPDDGEEKNAHRIEDWCKRARKRNAHTTGINDTFRRRMAQLIIERKSYPPYPEK